MRVRALDFSRHAVERMLTRRIDATVVRAVVEGGEVVESYPGDHPYPSVLMLAVVDGRAMHVVAGYDQPTETAIVVTVYEPDPLLWHSDWKKRR